MDVRRRLNGRSLPTRPGDPRPRCRRRHSTRRHRREHRPTVRGVFQRAAGCRRRDHLRPHPGAFGGGKRLGFRFGFVFGFGSCLGDGAHPFAAFAPHRRGPDVGASPEYLSDSRARAHRGGCRKRSRLFSGLRNAGVMRAAQAGSLDESPEAGVERSPGVARGPSSPSLCLRLARVAPRARRGLGRESRDRPRLRTRPLDCAKHDVRHLKRVPARSALWLIGRVRRKRSEGNACRGNRRRIPRRCRGFRCRAFPDPIARVAEAKHSALERLGQRGDRDRVIRLPRGPGVTCALRRRRLGGRAAPGLLVPSVDAAQRAIRREPEPARCGPRQRAHGGAHTGRRTSVAERQSPSSAAVTLVPVLRSCAEVIIRRSATPRTPRDDGWRVAVDDEAVLSVPAREHVPRRGNVLVVWIIIAQARVAVEKIGWHRWTGRHCSPRPPVHENVTALS